MIDKPSEGGPAAGEAIKVAAEAASEAQPEPRKGGGGKARSALPKLRTRRRKRAAPGAAPGTLVVSAELPGIQIRTYEYSEEKVEERDVKDLADLEKFIKQERKTVVWIDIQGLGDADSLRRIGEALGLHLLTVEDIAHVDQRPKTEEFGDYLFLTARMIRVLEGNNVGNEQMSFVLKNTLLATFQETPGDCFDPVRRRLREGKGFLRKSGPDYMAYALVDALIDNYFPVLDLYGETLDRLDDEAMLKPGRATVHAIYQMKQELRQLRRGFWPLRDVVGSLSRSEAPHISGQVRVALRDCYDHMVQVVDLLETQREMASDLVDIYLSMMSEKTNQVMKVLTIIATIFIPLTFIAGIYGMNFEHMPELGWKYSYLMFWLAILIISLIMMYLFRRLGWLGGAERSEPESKDRSRKKN